MQGTILNIDNGARSGVISGDDGNRYKFSLKEFKSPNNTPHKAPQAGSRVDFDVSEYDKGIALDIYFIEAAGSNRADMGDKSRVAAALFAFFLGLFGVHKFYLGKTNAGIITLICGTIGWLLIVPPFAVGFIAFIEFIIYLTKTDQQFYDEYVVGNKSWF